LTGRVIDSSAIAKFLLKEKGWERVKGFLLEKPYTLELAMKEVTNAIWRRVTLLRDIGVEKALIILNDLLELKKSLLKVEPQDPYLGQALKIAIESKIPVYDALFIVQAITKQAVLITSDERQCKLAESLNVETVYI